jgi:hypothetical protein
MRRRLALGLATTALCLVTAPALTAGAFEVLIRATPTLVDVNEAVHVRLIVYAVTANGRLLSDARRFHVVAVSPLGDRTPIGLRHVGRGTWSGTVRLRVAGRWLIRISDWRGKAGVPTVPVHVREPASLPGP